MPKAVIRGRQYCAKKIMICYAAISVQRAGLSAGWELLFVRPQLLLIENIKLNLRTKVESCLPSPNHSLALQFADVF